MPSEPPPPGGTPVWGPPPGPPIGAPPPSGPPGTSGPTPPDEVRRFATPRRLHPASIVLGLNLRQLIQAAVFPVVATLASGAAVLTIGFLLVLAVVGLIVRGLAWERFRFSFDGEVIRIEEGVLSRNRRTLDVARVQQVEIDRSLIQRAFGLAALRIETAGSSMDVEVDLRVLPDADAVALRAAVRAGKARATGQPLTAGGTAGPGGSTDVAEPPSRELISVPLGHVVLASITGARLLVFPAVVAAAFQFAGELTTTYINESVERLVEQGRVAADQLVSGPSVSTIVVIAVGTLLLSLVTAVAVGVLRDANFRVVRVDDDLHVSRGLLSTRESVLPLRRVQLVEVQRNWIRRALGYATIRIHSAGGSADADRRVAIPLVADGSVDDILAQLLPGVAGIPDLVGHPPTALRRAILRWVRPALVPGIGLIALDTLTAFEPPSWAAWVAGLLPLLAVAAGAVEYRVLAHGLTDRVVVSRSGALSITTSIAPLVKVQAVSRRSSWFQRRLGLATVVAHVAGPGGDVQVLDAGSPDAVSLHGRLTQHAASPIPVGPAAEPAVPGAGRSDPEHSS
jgi:putative membrane protein